MKSKFTSEQIDKLKACKTAEEAKALAEKENIELTDEQLEEVASGKEPNLVRLPSNLQESQKPQKSIPDPTFQKLF